MTKRTSKIVAIVWVGLYICLLEVLLYGFLNHWRINSWLLANAIIIAFTGWIPSLWWLLEGLEY